MSSHTIQVDKLEREDFIQNMITAGPSYTTIERECLIRAIEYADFRLVSNNAEKYNPVEPNVNIGKVTEKEKKMNWKRIQVRREAYKKRRTN